MKYDLIQASRIRVLVAAHRGVAGGNIPCNSMAAFEAALAQGADMIEIDVARSADGVLYVFHPGMESAHLYSARLISEMESREVDMLYLVNQDRTATQFHVPRLTDVLERFRGRCFINIDKFWDWPREIAEAVRAFGMQDQALVKTFVHPGCFDAVEEVAPDIPYMVVAREKDECTDALLKRKLRYAGVEALFETDEAPIASPAYIEDMHEKGLLVWANAIVYNHRAVLASGHSDDISAQGDYEAGWGWLARRGFDIIQTDWVMPMIRYLEKIGKR